jgi:hypothetical protein
VVHFDDLGGLEEPGRLGREAHHQDRPDGEVRHDEDAGRGRLPEPAAHLGQPVLAEAGRADDGVKAPLDAPAEVVHDRARVGEVDDDVAAGQRLAVVALVDLRGHVEPVGGADRPAHLAAHAPLGPGHAHLDHGTTFSLRVPVARDECGLSFPQMPRKTQPDAGNACAPATGGGTR